MSSYRMPALVLGAAALQILSFLPSGFPLALVFAVPLFFFLAAEKRLWVLLAGFFAYRMLAMSGLVYFVLDPVMFAASTAVFLGFPFSFWTLGKFGRKAPWLLSPFLWTFWDYLSARYTALPNFVMMAGNALGDSPFLGLASLWGLVSLTFFVIAANLLAFGFIKNVRKNGNLRFALGTGLAVVLLGGWAVSAAALRENRENYGLRPESARVILVSESGGLDEVFRNGTLPEAELASRIAEHLGRLKRALAGKPSGLLVLPEAMIDVDSDAGADPEAFSKFGIANNATLIAGYRNLARNLGRGVAANIVAVREGKRYNALLFFDERGNLEDVFYKKYLAITGEYWPFGDWRPFYFNWAFRAEPEEFADYAMFHPEKSFSSGETKTVRSGDLVLAPAICLEIHYPAEMRKRAGLGAHAIMDTSSNLWADWGLGQYLRTTDNLRRIESVWLKIPILANGRREPPSLFLPGGEIEGRDSAMKAGSYEILPVEFRF